MAALASFLPPHLVRALSQRLPGRLPHVDRFPAALLFSDVSGFTALTERLQGRGREGAEEIAATINAALAPAIGAIHRQDGSIVSFGGDSLFALFQGPRAVTRATAAAAAIRETFARQGEIGTSVGRVTLGISQAVHYGKVLGIHVGTPDRRHYLVQGGAVATLARLEARASGGKLLVSAAARARRPRERGKPRDAAPALRAAAGRLRPYLAARLTPLLPGFDGEYRRAAVLFLETSGSSPALLDKFFRELGSSLDRHGGVLLKTDLSPAGAKWVSVFGIPQAHEEDPDRAARAALHALATRPRGLALRGGLHAGVVANVLVGRRDRRAFDVIGDVVNTAARAMAEAPWGEVLVTEEAMRLLSGVTTEPRGRRVVKGKEAPLELHALVAARAALKPIRISAPLIGRDAELQRIVDVLESAKTGSGGVVGIKGEPGLGKSRLEHEAAKASRLLGFEVHEGRALSFGGTAYGTIASLLRDAVGLPDLPGATEVIAHVSTAAQRYALPAVVRHHLADVLGARLPGSPIEHLPPRDVRLNTMLAVRTFGQALASERPRLLVLEDMHWADGASVEAVEWLARGAKDGRYVVLLLYRPGYAPPKETMEIVLDELGAHAVDALLDALLGGAPQSVRKLVHERAGGNPFYVEEMVRHLLESGALETSQGPPRLARGPRVEDLPHGIETLIAARLDLLPPDVRKVAQLAAIIGRTFLPEVLERLTETPAAARAAIAELCRRDLAFVGHRGARVEYTFRHALTRDVAYATILAARRRKLHAAVADALEKEYAGERDTLLSMLGHHWERAGRIPVARKCYLEGARLAATRFAHEEAERLYRSYLGLVETTSEESILARNALADKVLRLCGRTSEAEVEHRRAIADAEERRLRRTEGVCRQSLGALLQAVGRMEEARQLQEHALAIHREVGERRLEGSTLSNLAIIHLEQSRFAQARTLQERALRLHREIGARRDEGVDLGILANIRHAQGCTEEARTLYESALAIARKVGDRQGEGISLGNLAILYRLEGREDEASVSYEQALAINREVGSRRGEAVVLGNLANLDEVEGRVELARSRYDQALALSRDTGDRSNEGHVLGNLANLERAQGLLEEAGRHYAQAAAIHHDLGDRLLEGIVLGDLAAHECLASGDVARAAALARRAESLIAEVGDRARHGVVLCTMGHIALASGESAAGLMASAREIQRELGEGGNATLGSAIERLERSLVAAAGGRPLVSGYRPEDVAAGQLRWLREHRPSALPPEVMARLLEDGTLRGNQSPPEGPSGPSGPP